MAALATKLFGGLVVLVALVSFISGPASAARTAANAGQTIGITIGSLIGSMDEMVSGFNQAKGHTAPKPQWKPKAQ